MSDRRTFDDPSAINPNQTQEWNAAKLSETLDSFPGGLHRRVKIQQQMRRKEITLATAIDYMRVAIQLRYGVQLIEDEYNTAVMAGANSAMTPIMAMTPREDVEEEEALDGEYIPYTPINEIVH